MAGSNLPTAELVAEFSTDDPPTLFGYHVVVENRPVALLTLDELSLAGFSPVHDVQAFEIAEDVKGGSILFWRPSDRKLHHESAAGDVPMGVTTKDLAAGSAVRPSFDGFVMLEGEFNLTDEELAAHGPPSS